MVVRIITNNIITKTKNKTKNNKKLNKVTVQIMVIAKVDIQQEAIVQADMTDRRETAIIKAVILPAATTDHKETITTKVDIRQEAIVQADMTDRKGIIITKEATNPEADITKIVKAVIIQDVRNKDKDGQIIFSKDVRVEAADLKDRKDLNNKSNYLSVRSN